MRNPAPRLVPLVAATLLATGCATVFHTANDDLKVVTDPPGATASASGVSVVTPGVLKVRRQNVPVVVRIEKEGFEPREIRVGWHRSGAVWTNVVGVGLGAVGTAVSSTCISVWYGPCESNPSYVPLLVGAALTAAGTAIDLSSDRALSLERDEIVLRLEPVRLAGAPGGALR